MAEIKNQKIDDQKLSLLSYYIFKMWGLMEKFEKKKEKVGILL